MEKFDEIQGIKDLVLCDKRLRKLIGNTVLSLTRNEAHVSTDWFFENFKKEDVVKTLRDSTDYPIELQHNFDDDCKIFTILTEKENEEWDKLNNVEASTSEKQQQ